MGRGGGVLALVDRLQVVDEHCCDMFNGRLLYVKPMRLPGTGEGLTLSWQRKLADFSFTSSAVSRTLAVDQAG